MLHQTSAVYYDFHRDTRYKNLPAIRKNKGKRKEMMTSLCVFIPPWLWFLPQKNEAE